jgi:thiol-disulfide isomerase/thioredoxin
MKKIYFVLLGLPLWAGAQAQDSGFVIHGTVRGLADRSSVFLTDANNPTDTLARTRVRDGAFLLKGRVPEPNLYEINFAGAKKKSLLFIGNDHLTVDGSVADIAALTVKGSPTQLDFRDMQKQFTSYFQQLNDVIQLANSPAGLSKRDSLSSVFSMRVAQVEIAIDPFIRERNSSPISAFLLLETSQLQDNILLLEKRFQGLSPGVQNSFFGRILREKISEGKVGAIGTDEIDFTQNDTTGKPVTLSSFKGKYVLVDFWASWCHPCRMENPEVVAAYMRFKNKNFTVLGVSLDRSREPWIKAIQDDSLTWVQVSDLRFWNNEVAVKYHIQSIPQNILIDPSGKIVGRNLRGQDLQSTLCGLLGCN